MKQIPNYYAILTAEVRYSTEINDFEKLLFADITALTNRNGYCTASNAYFGELFGKSERTIRRAISNICTADFLDLELIYKEGTKEVKERRLYLRTNLSSPTDKNGQHPADKNGHYNNTRDINNTSKKTKAKKVKLPEWLDTEAWTLWEQHRKEIKKPLTPTATTQQLKLLSENKADHVAIIERSIQNGWTGLFKIQNNTRPAAGKKTPEKGSLAYVPEEEDELIEVEVIS